MPVALHHMFETQRQGIDHYFRVVYSETDKGLDATELKWKRDWERDMDRWADKWDRIFS